MNTREFIAANPDVKIPKYQFASTTGYQGLRRHLESQHKEEYLRKCQENGWKVQLPNLMKEQKEALAEVRKKAQEARSPFTPEALLQHLVNFIVADDQVSSNQLPWLKLVTISIGVEHCHKSRVSATLTPSRGATGGWGHSRAYEDSLINHGIPGGIFYSTEG
jgi:hypothetical protein